MNVGEFFENLVLLEDRILVRSVDKVSAHGLLLPAGAKLEQPFVLFEVMSVGKNVEHVAKGDKVFLPDYAMEYIDDAHAIVREHQVIAVQK